MKLPPEHIRIPSRVEGRTYTLFGDGASTDQYYDTVELLLDELLTDFPDEHHLHTALRDISKRHRASLRQVLFSRSGRKDDSLLREHYRRIDEALSPYTAAAESHLAQLPLLKRRNRVLAMSRSQYHFAMLEIALVNRMQRTRFAQCTYRIALLPHCLRDLSRECKAERDGLDLRCWKCSKDCFVRHLSDLLEEHGIIPYLWMDLGRRELFRALRKESSAPAVLGVACVPELLSGMRMCLRGGVPVVGLPLSANRCGRWMGEVHPNSISLRRLADLIS